jgi:GMP synthase (glutamine-hydrolysing)
LLLVVDNGSVYTPSLLDSIKNLNIDFEHYVFSNVSSLNLDNYSSIILSGRRKNDSEMNILNSKLVKYSVGENKPLLGICYGAEILALTLGGTIKKMASPRHGLHEIGITKSNPLCSGKIQGFESHSYMVSKLNSSFTKIASSADCEFEIFQYDGKNIFGTQFHPEMSSDGKDLLEKFCSIK